MNTLLQQVLVNRAHRFYWNPGGDLRHVDVVADLGQDMLTECLDLPERWVQGAALGRLRFVGEIGIVVEVMPTAVVDQLDQAPMAVHEVVDEAAQKTEENETWVCSMTGVYILHFNVQTGGGGGLRVGNKIYKGGGGGYDFQ